MVFSHYILQLLAVGSAALGVVQASATISTVFQSNISGTWFENLAIRTNGDILATRLDSAELWTVNPFTRTSSKLLSFPQFSSLVGITEISNDLFILATGNFTARRAGVPGTGVPGTMQVLEIDLRGPTPISRVAAIVPEGEFFNGLTRWDDESVLVADSTKGLIWKVNVTTGESSIAISDITMTIPENASYPLGVNGVKVFDSYIYYTSTARQLFCRIPVDEWATPTGPAQIIASGIPQDDFTILPDGTSYIATNSLDTIVKVEPDGSISHVAGITGSSELGSDTACQFGRMGNDSNILYVTTGGGQFDIESGTVTIPGAVMAVNLDGC